MIAAPAALRAYESDGLTAYRQPPLVAVLPSPTAEVAAVLRYCHGRKLKVVPRGSGTSLSGGALPLADGVLLGLGKLNRILEIDIENRCAIVQPGVPNLAISHAVADRGFYYAPDPSSQIACSIGGNVAENSGGVHCLKYGLTTNNLLGLEVVLMRWRGDALGGRHFDAAGYDLMGILTGSEGLLGVVTEVTVRLLRRPPTARALLAGFASNEAAGEAVAAIIAAGIIPAGMEMMDRPGDRGGGGFRPCRLSAGSRGAADRRARRNGRRSRRADGPRAGDRAGQGRDLAARQPVGAGAAEILGRAQGGVSRGRAHLAGLLLHGRHHPAQQAAAGADPHGGDVAAFRTEGRQCVPCRRRQPASARSSTMPTSRASWNRREKFGAEILRLCVEVGGVLTGEHGVGVEKRDLMPAMFSEVDLDQQMRLKCAFDEHQLLNPGKVFPTLRRCAELGAMHVSGGRLPFPDLPRF